MGLTNLLPREWGRDRGIGPSAPMARTTSMARATCSHRPESLIHAHQEATRDGYFSGPVHEGVLRPSLWLPRA